MTDSEEVELDAGNDRVNDWDAEVPGKLGTHFPVLSSEEWAKLEEIRALLQPFKLASEHLSGSSYCTFSNGGSSPAGSWRISRLTLIRTSSKLARIRTLKLMLRR